MQEADNKRVVDRLAELMRETRARSVRSFALSFNADPSFYAKIHKGDVDLTERIANDISEKYGVNKEWIFTGRGQKKKDNLPPATIIEKILLNLSEAHKIQSAILERIKDDTGRIDLKTENLWNGLQAVALRQGADREIQLRSLARLEGIEESELIEASNRRIGELARSAAEPDIEDGGRSQRTGSKVP